MSLAVIQLILAGNAILTMASTGSEDDGTLLVSSGGHSVSINLGENIQESEKPINIFNFMGGCCKAPGSGNNCTTPGWSRWGQWSSCSKMCGEGVRSRERQCLTSDQSNCEGPLRQEETCFRGNCSDAFVMIIGGWNGAAPEDKVTVHSLDPVRNPVPDCIKQLNPLPFNTHAAAVGTLGSDNIPVVCGGDDRNNPMPTNCLLYEPSTDSWKNSSHLSTSRAYPGWAHHPAWGLVVAGGRSYGGTFRNTIDLIKDGNENGYLPPMPEYVHFPCVGIVDEDRILVTLGATKGNEGTGTQVDKMLLYMYSRSTGEWKQMADVPYRSRSAMCGVVKNQGKLEFVVAGGYTISGGLYNEVAIFEVEENIWRTGRRTLPMYTGISLPFEDTFLITAAPLLPPQATGTSRHNGIYKYEIETEEWTKLPGEIQNDRLGSAVLVNRDLFPEC